MSLVWNELRSSLMRFVYAHHRRVFFLLLYVFLIPMRMTFCTIFIPHDVLVQQSFLTVYTHFGCRFFPNFIYLFFFFFFMHNTIQCACRLLGIIITDMIVMIGRFLKQPRSSKYSSRSVNPKTMIWVHNKYREEVTLDICLCHSKIL